MYVTNNICNDQSIDKLFIYDLVFDCGANREDEPILMSLLVNKTYSSCAQPYMISCMEGHSKCYYLRDICTYRLDIYHHMIPCRNGGHLEYCKNFECNMMVKCFVSYCIPWSHVCDEKWNCPEGDNEFNNPVCTGDQQCVHMFKCRNRKHTCLHIGNMCDGNMDCPLGDDEYLCELKNMKCPLNCNCLVLAIQCSSVLELMIKTQNQYPFLSVCMFNTSVDSLLNLDDILEFVLVLKLLRNSLREICNILLLRYILVLDVRYNCSKRILNSCFSTFCLL